MSRTGRSSTGDRNPGKAVGGPGYSSSVVASSLGSAAERRARLAARHRLAAPARAGSAAKVAESLIALHGTDPASVYLAV